MKFGKNRTKRLTDQELGYAAALQQMGHLYQQLEHMFNATVAQKHGVQGGFTLGPKGEIIEPQQTTVSPE